MGGTGSSAAADGWNSAGPSSERYVSGYQCTWTLNFFFSILDLNLRRKENEKSNYG